MTQKTVLVVTSGGPQRAGSEDGFLVSHKGLATSWRSFPPMFKLSLSGVGTCQVDALNADNSITTAVASFNVNGPVVKYPYPGDEAIAIRAYFTGSCSGEII